VCSTPDLASAPLLPSAAAGSLEPAPGEEREILRLERAHGARVLRLCRWLLGDPSEAEELGQEVWMRVVRQWRGGQHPDDWRAWITRVTVNACHDRRRSAWWRLGRSQADAPPAAELVARGASPEQEAAAGEERRRIWQAFRRLPTRQREVFALRHLEGHSTGEIALLLGIAPGSVKRHLFRAVRALRAALRREP
jgi:RNA polymerase sigma-70 factor (ECF subfamily)